MIKFLDNRNSQLMLRSFGYLLSLHFAALLLTGCLPPNAPGLESNSFLAVFIRPDFEIDSIPFAYEIDVTQSYDQLVAGIEAYADSIYASPIIADHEYGVFTYKLDIAPRFTRNQLARSPQFLRELHKPTTSVGKGLQKYLGKYQDDAHLVGKQPPDAIRHALNQVIYSEALYDPQLFQDAKLRPTTKRLIKQSIDGAINPRLNRRLLQDYFRSDLSRAILLDSADQLAKYILTIVATPRSALQQSIHLSYWLNGSRHDGVLLQHASACMPRYISSAVPNDAYCEDIDFVLCSNTKQSSNCLLSSRFVKGPGVGPLTRNYANGFDSAHDARYEWIFPTRQESGSTALDELRRATLKVLLQIGPITEIDHNSGSIISPPFKVSVHLDGRRSVVTVEVLLRWYRWLQANAPKGSDAQEAVLQHLKRIGTQVVTQAEVRDNMNDAKWRYLR